jgi:hypothetical protein
LVPIAEPDYRAALRSQERYLSLAVIRERWRRFCRNNSVDAGAVMLPVDWEQGWRFLVEDERRAVELWERRRAKTLEMMARAKAAAEAASTPEAVEAARVKALTPGQREAESNARMDVMSARYAESDARTAFLKLINQRSPRSPEPERQAAREAIGLAEAERDRLEANHKRIVEVHRLANAKRRRPLQSHDRKHEPPAGSWVAEHERAEKVRQADAAWLRSLGKKARKVELEKRRAAMFAAYEAQRARSDRIRAMNEARRARMAAEAAREARKH